MKCSLVKLDNLSGDEASIYTIYMSELKKTLFEVFLEENSSIFKSEIIDILYRLKVMGNETGARTQFFKLKEGELGDGVCALYDKPNKKLRLYCVHYGNGLLVLGGGGHKSKNITAFQDDEKLLKENYFLRNLVKEITTQMKDKELKINFDDINFFEGDLNFDLEY